MKKTFEEPKMEIVVVTENDVIATSGFAGLEDEFEMTV